MANGRQRSSVSPNNKDPEWPFSIPVKMKELKSSMKRLDRLNSVETDLLNGVRGCREVEVEVVTVAERQDGVSVVVAVAVAGVSMARRKY